MKTYKELSAKAKIRVLLGAYALAVIIIITIIISII